MDLPKRFARRGILLALQITAALISILIGLATITKESAPLVERVQEQQRQAAIAKQQEMARIKATQISQMGIQWQFRGHDGTWRYYSDSSGRYWFRTNIEGIQEYSENPQIHLAIVPVNMR